MEAKPHVRATLEIMVISGENISIDRSPIAENVYVVVRAESLNCCSTKMVKENGGVLAWNEKFTLDIPMHAKSITFEVQCKKYKGTLPIGVARIGLSDFLGQISDKGDIQMMSYGLTNSDGRRNGVLHFSVRVMAAAATEEDWLCLEPDPMKGAERMSSRGYENEFLGSQVGKKGSHGVVIGVLDRFRCCLNFLKFSFIFGFAQRKKSV